MYPDYRTETSHNCMISVLSTNVSYSHALSEFDIYIDQSAESNNQADQHLENLTSYEVCTYFALLQPLRLYLLDFPLLIGIEAAKMGRAPQLPFDVILMILQRLSFDKVFSLNGDVLREALVAKLNNGYLMDGKHLKPLSEHPQIFSRLSRMSVRPNSEREMKLLGEILEQCSNLKSLALELEIYRYVPTLERHRQVLQQITKLCLDCITSKETCAVSRSFCEQCPNLDYLALNLSCHNLRKLNEELLETWPLAKLSVHLFHEHNIPLLEEICDKCSNLELEIKSIECWQELQNNHKLLRRLKNLRVYFGRTDDFPLLSSICERYPINLDLQLHGCLQKLFEYPAIRRQLTELSLGSISKEDSVLLDSRKLFPNLRSWRLSV